MENKKVKRMIASVRSGKWFNPSITKKGKPIMMIGSFLIEQPEVSLTAEQMDRKRAPVFWGGSLGGRLEMESKKAEGISLSLTQSSLNGAIQAWGARGAQL